MSPPPGIRLLFHDLEGSDVLGPVRSFGIKEWAHSRWSAAGQRVR
jgi:hypothetical protein